MTRRCCLLALSALLVGLALSDARGQDENPVVKLIKSKVKDPNRPFAILVTFKVKAGNEAAFEAAFRPALAATRKEPGCVSYELNRDTEQTGNYVMYEQFRSVAAIDEHIRAPYTQTLLKTVVPMCEGDPQIKVLTVPQ